MGQVDPVLQRVISRAVHAAHASGRDMSGQAQAAIAAVLTVRPDLTALEAVRAVNLHQSASTWTPFFIGQQRPTR